MLLIIFTLQKFHKSMPTNIIERITIQVIVDLKIEHKLLH